MAVRLVVSINAAPGKGAEFARAFKPRCELSRTDRGCQQFELFQSIENPDKFALLELWESPEALADHAKQQAARPPFPEGLRAGRRAPTTRKAAPAPIARWSTAPVSSRSWASTGSASPSTTTRRAS